MKKREIFSLLAACHEVTYDDKDGQRHVYIDEEKTIKKLDDLKKAVGSLPKDVQEIFKTTQERVITFLRSYRIKYPHLMDKAESMYDPSLVKRKPREKIVVTTGMQTPPAEPKEGE